MRVCVCVCVCVSVCVSVCVCARACACVDLYRYLLINQTITHPYISIYITYRQPFAPAS